jgi:GTPase SAR1 family protein
LTARLGATIDVEQNHVRFLGDLILNLWDCGGQDAFMDSYLTTQRSTIFQHVGVMIYVFDVETRGMSKDLEYYRDCLEGLKQFSPDAAVFLLVHKMDLVREPRNTTFDKKKKELEEASGEGNVTVFGTSIYDESLYKVKRFFPSRTWRLILSWDRHGRALCIPSSPTPPSFQSICPHLQKPAAQLKSSFLNAPLSL